MRGTNNERSERRTLLIEGQVDRPNQYIITLIQPTLHTPKYRYTLSVFYTQWYEYVKAQPELN